LEASTEKNTGNQIIIYGIPPGFDSLGIMHELLHGLKESDKEFCDGNCLTLEQSMLHRELGLPLINGYYKQATPPKAS
jgi:hypothetical protein